MSGAMKSSALVVFLAAMGCGVEHAPTEAQGTGGGGKADGAQVGPIQTLKCAPSGNFREFTATLDGSGYDAGSGYFDVRDASVNDGYATAPLICTGHTQAEIDCIGFWFDISSEVAEVTLANDATGLTASHVSLRGDLVHAGGPWP